MNSIFIKRYRCPVCDSDNSSYLYTIKCDDESFKRFLEIEKMYGEDFWEDYNKYELYNEEFVISKCEECGFIFQNNILNEFGMSLLYGIWINEDKLISHRKDNSKNPEIYKYYKNTMAVVKAVLKRNDIKIIDYGAGTAEVYNAVHQLGFDITALEYSEKRVSWLQENGYKVVHNREIKNNKYDLVIMNQVLEHIPDPKEVLRNVYEILSNNGLMIISTPDCRNVENFIKKGNLDIRLFEYLSPHQHINAFTNKSLKGICDIIGFKSININKLYNLRDVSFVFLLKEIYKYLFKTSLIVQKK